MVFAQHHFFKLTRVFVFIALATLAHSEEKKPNDAFFEKKIRPVLVKYCYECHSTESEELGGKLLLDTKEGMLKGGESGPALIAGRPKKSALIQALLYDNIEMPPDEPLPQTVINDFITWIEQGARDPRTDKVSVGKDLKLDRKALWSFQPKSNPPVPEVANKAWAYDPIDQFILEKMEAANLTPTKDAKPKTLIRRLYYDLTGLPPTVQQMEAFVEEHKRDGALAMERLVDDLLSQPQYGERWGQHWLDVARYAESNGDDGLGRNATFPHAWRYRDYVIDAFNRDVPYDRFLTEQIAGDLLPAANAEQRNRQLIATGFLAIGSKPAAAMNKNFPMDIVDDQINVISTATMGLSVSCARCHDHKHDPIPTSDYYALAGIFSSTETLYGLAGKEKLTAPSTPLHELRSIWNEELARNANGSALKLPAAYFEKTQKFQPLFSAKLDTKPEDLKVPGDVQFSSEKFARFKTKAIAGKLPESGENYSVSFWFKNDTDNNKRPITAYLFSRAAMGDKGLPGDHIGIGGTHDKSRAGKLFVFNGNAQKKSVAGKNVIKKGTWNHIVLIRKGEQIKLYLNGGPQPEIDAKLPATYGDSPDYCFGARSDQFAPLVGNIADFNLFSRPLSDQEAVLYHATSNRPRPPKALGLAMGVRDKAKPTNTKIHIKGDIGKQGPVIPRGFLSIYDQFTKEKDSSFQSIKIDPKQSGRLQLTEWLTHPDHPQVARVIVNRVWMHLFGQSIVSTPDDFGVYGSRPTHPELLDHLATRLIQEKWSIKQLIKAIVLTRTYQLSSRATSEAVEQDPENNLYARHKRRRLDAESLRDSILQASGQLDRTPGKGSAIETIDQLINWPPGEATNLHKKSNHRSIYLCMLRHAPPAELSAFDLPDAVKGKGKRNVTTLPTQTLFLLNSPFVIEQSKLHAEFILKQSDWDPARKVQEIFHRTLQRAPTSSEKEQALKYLTSVKQNLDQELKPEEKELQSWSSLCQALFTTNEFRYID